jgi:lysophospholipase L1-like esterase
MMRITRTRLAGLALASVTLGLAGACEKSADIVRPVPTPGDDLFRSYVNLGNSIGAGYQSGGIVDSTQLQSYAVVFANQVGTRFAVPLLKRPGCPPPLTNFATQARLDNAAAQSCAFRDPASVTGIINNVAVPGALAADPTANGNGPGSSILTQMILGGETQVQRALEAKPTFVTVEIVGNDILAPAGSGQLGGVTPVATFTANIDKIVDPLVAAGVKGGVLFGTANVLHSALFFPAAALQNPQFAGSIAAAAGVAPTALVIHPNCVGSSSLISFPGIVAFLKASPVKIIACQPNTIPGTPVGDIGVLDATEQATLTATVDAYNAYVQQKANTVGWGYYDVNKTLDAAVARGDITIVNLGNPTQPFGPFMSIDPVHPSALGHKYITNDLIDVVNAKYGTSIPKVTIP